MVVELEVRVEGVVLDGNVGGGARGDGRVG